MVQLLLKNLTIDIDFATFGKGYTPLIVACLTGNFEIVQLLLEAGAEVNKPSFINFTSL